VHLNNGPEWGPLYSNPAVPNDPALQPIAFRSFFIPRATVQPSPPPRVRDRRPVHRPRRQLRATRLGRLLSFVKNHAEMAPTLPALIDSETPGLSQQ